MNGPRLCWMLQQLLITLIAWLEAVVRNSWWFPETEGFFWFWFLLAECCHHLLVWKPVSALLALFVYAVVVCSACPLPALSHTSHFVFCVNSTATIRNGVWNNLLMNVTFFSPYKLLVLLLTKAFIFNLSRFLAQLTKTSENIKKLLTL